jgi:hypothetical protein
MSTQPKPDDSFEDYLVAGRESIDEKDEAAPLRDGIAANAVAADQAGDSQALIDTILATGARAVTGYPPACQPNAIACL